MTEEDTSAAARTIQQGFREYRQKKESVTEEVTGQETRKKNSQLKASSSKNSFITCFFAAAMFMNGQFHHNYFYLHI